MSKHGRKYSSITFRRIRVLIWIKLFSSLNLPGVCYWCERQLRFEYSTLDHVPALSKGGRPKLAVISCSICNHSNDSNHSVTSIPDYLGTVHVNSIRNELDGIYKMWLSDNKSRITDMAKYSRYRSDKV